MEHIVYSSCDCFGSPGTLDSSFININAAAVAVIHPLTLQNQGRKKKKKTGALVYISPGGAFINTASVV